MPVISQLAEVIKLTKSLSGGIPGEISAITDAMSQVQIATASRQPVSGPPGSIPVIPFGAPISTSMITIEALLFKAFELLSAIVKQLLEQYYAEIEKAKIKRESALKTLNANLLIAQEKVIEELVELKIQLEDINKTILELTQEQEQEMEKYMATIFEIRDRAVKKEEEGNDIERDYILQELKKHDSWLADIIKLNVDIILLKLQIASLEKEIAEKEYLSTVSIPMNWDTDVGLADLFEVAVPAYPDIPWMPVIPAIPPIPEEPELVKAMRKAYGMWLVTPTVAPMGVIQAAILLYIQSQAPAPGPLAAKMEADSCASILQGGGLI